MALQGYNIAPFLFLGGIGLLLALLLTQKTLLPSTRVGTTLPLAGITFADVGGQEVAKQELQEALDFIVREGAASRLGIRPLKGILLAGPPGTGKTLLAKAAAGYTDAVFLAASGSEFIEVYAGIGAQRVRALFRQARELATRTKKNRAVVFIDELEILGSHRATHRGHLEYDQTLNQLLVEMDGIREEKGVNILVIGATNRLDMVDLALLRPGRFDRLLRVDLPDQQGRYEILLLHTKNKPLAPDVDLKALAQETFGFSGAQLESVANEAAIFAFRAGEKLIGQSHLREAVDKVLLGEKGSRKPSAEEKYRIAVHEAGHALTSEWMRPGSVSYFTITSRANTLGYTRQVPQTEMLLFTREDFIAQIRILLGGAVAEQIIFGDRSTGAGQDAEQVLNLTRQMIDSGVSELGIVVPPDFPPEFRYRTLMSIISPEEKAVEGILSFSRELLEEVAQKLVSTESMTGDTLRTLLSTFRAKRQEKST